MFDILFRGLTSLASFVFPVLASYKSMEHNDVSLIRPWLIYWVVVALQLTVESYFGFLLQFVPFYYLFRFLLTLWLVLPQFQGASKVYLGYVEPFLRKHETEIDHCISKTYKTCRNLSTEYVSMLVEMLKESVRAMIFGPSSSSGDNVSDSSKRMGARSSSADTITPGSTPTQQPRKGASPVPAGSWLGFLWKSPQAESVKQSAEESLKENFKEPESSYWDMFLSKFRITDSGMAAQRGADFLSSYFTMPIDMSKPSAILFLDQQRSKLVNALKQLDEKRTMLESVDDAKNIQVESAIAGISSAIPGSTPNTSSGSIPRTTSHSELGSDFDVVLEDEGLPDGTSSKPISKQSGWLWKS